MAIFEPVHISCLTQENGSEFFISAQVHKALSFADAVKKLQCDYIAARKNAGLDEDTEIWVRFFLSDIQNQVPCLYEEWKASPSAFLCPIGQPPLDSPYISLLAYHTKAQSVHKQTSAPDALSFTHGQYTSLMHNFLPEKPADGFVQTNSIIGGLLNALAGSKATLEDDVLRTWYYVRDIDNNYMDMVRSRRQHYESHGLRPDTRFIASTGIEALAPSPWVLSWMTSLTTLGLQPKQIRFLQALDFLSPTHVYGVNFERATRVSFGDRAHIHLSGTASIDRTGQVVHVGDVHKQAARTVENIEALFAEGHMNLQDIQYAIIYLRDGTEFSQVAPFLRQRLGDIPCVAVRGAVCRPEWLIEVEGLAGKASIDTAFAPYF